MAEAAVTFLLENVQKLLFEQIHLINGAENELKQLQKELDLMKAVLEEAADKREKGQVFLEYERQIRDVVYEAEDILDACLTQAAAEQSSTIQRLNPRRLNLARKVKSLREDVLRPIFDRARTDLTSLPMAAASGATSEKPDDVNKIQLLRQDNVVGFEDEVETLIHHLLAKSEELEVLSIIGMPGLGKTTLAWKIYRDPRIQFEFPALIWVYVSQDFNMKEVFLTILKRLSHQSDISSLNDHELVEKVRSSLEGKKFLLFMDDVWTVEAWDSIKAALPTSNKLGKVLITSRHAAVACVANPKRKPHMLRFLNFDESWKLFQLEALGKIDECPQELAGLGKKIAQQCGGVPLAIVVIAGFLKQKSLTSGNRKDEWEKVSKSVSAYFNYDGQKRTENIIALSYNKLPHDLRDCFLYLGMFPEDTEIPAWKLIRLWIAEGFIQQRLERSWEEVAKDNLEDLVARNLVMVDKFAERGDVKTCRVHDMIREFCQNEAALENKNLFQEVKKSSEGVFHPNISKILQRRRLCIHSHVMDFLQESPKGPGVRTFLCFSKEPISLPPEHNKTIPDAFDLLRVLDVNPIRFTRFPPKVTKLIHLRYIALSFGDDLKALPEAVSKLWNLQTIKIDTTLRSFEIKANIWKMMQLRHLKTKAAIVLSRGMKGEGGKNLQTLCRLSAECCTKDVFNKASNLKNLGVRGQLDNLVKVNCLENLDRLEKLKLVHDVFPHVTSEKPLCGLPHQDRFPPNLRILKLSSTFLDWKHMPTLGMLRTLEVLKLKENAFVGELWEAVGGGFPSLEHLLIARTDLKIWTASGDPFPKLKCLVLKNCEKLAEIPSQLGKSLEILDIERVTKTLVASAKIIEEEKQPTLGEQRAGTGGFKLIIAPGDVTTTSSNPESAARQVQ